MLKHQWQQLPPAAAGQQQPNPAAGATVPQADKDFVINAAVSGMFEVQSSQMATTASQDSAVQEFARQMVTEHTAANLFDKTYGRQQVRAHNEAITFFTKASNELTDQELKAFAVKTLPVLQHHAEMTQRLPGADKAGKQGSKQSKPQQQQQPQ